MSFYVRWGLCLCTAAVAAGAAHAADAELLAAPAAQASDDAQANAEPHFKLTLGRYHLASHGAPASDAYDVNLRHSSQWGNAWVGWYEQHDAGIRQERAGWDRYFQLGALRVQPSVQAASGGFWGGSLYAEGGSDWFAGAGLGRTNLKNYANLNFDPNDAITLAAGRRWEDGNAITLLLVADNRQNPDQRHLHLNYRLTIAPGERLTVDLLAKRGNVSGQLIRRFGFSGTYDWPRFFVRLAWDPKVNFTDQNMVRASAGTRF